MNSDGVYNFIEYLDKLEEMIGLFKGVTTSSEIMGELPLTEEQILLANAYLEKIQTEWSKSFVSLLKFGVDWLEKNEELED